MQTTVIEPEHPDSHLVNVDEIDDEGGANARSKADAPEIDGQVFLRDAGHLAQGDIVSAKIEDADDHDLFGVPC